MDALPLSTSQKKRQKKQLKKLQQVALPLSPIVTPTPETGLPVVPPTPPVAPTVTREDLQARVKQLRNDARAKRAVSKRVQLAAKTQEATKASKTLMDQFRTGTLSKRHLESLAELEKEFYEDCHGDATLFCAKKQIDARAVPVIETAIQRVKAGEAPENTIKDTVASLTNALC
jgi:hypothetical protein